MPTFRLTLPMMLLNGRLWGLYAVFCRHGLFDGTACQPGGLSTELSCPTGNAAAPCLRKMSHPIHVFGMATRTVGGVQLQKRTTIIAIDYGTHGSGFGYSVDGGASIKLHQAYPDQPRAYPKTLTATLYKNRSPISIGWTARKAFLSRGSQSSSHSHDPASSDTATYRLATGFKVLLHNPEGAAAQQLPPGINAVQAAADYLGLLRRYILAQMREELGPGSAHLMAPGSVTWIITVPALWSDCAKGDMREVAIRAGFIKRDDPPEQLVIALEPESAALWAKHKRATVLNPRDTFMVLDAGGGTVDWTVHECVERGGQTVLAEAVYAVGELLGSTLLDAAFMDHLRGVVGEESFDAWIRLHPEERMLVLDKWEVIKCLPRQQRGPGSLTEVMTRLSVEDEDVCHQIPIPPGLRTIMTSSGTSRQRVQCDSIILSGETLRDLFDPILDRIIGITKQQLKRVADSRSTTRDRRARVDKVLLVGGFSASPYLQDRVREELRREEGAPEVVLVDQPYAAVLQGAVLYGCFPEIIHARRSRSTYGIKCSAPYKKGAPGRKFLHTEDRVYYSSSFFQKFVGQGQLVQHNETVTHTFRPLYTYSTECKLLMFIVDKESPRFVDDMDADTRKLAELLVKLDCRNTTYNDRCIEVTFQFGRAEVMATAKDLSTGNSLQTSFKFASG